LVQQRVPASLLVSSLLALLLSPAPARAGDVSLDPALDILLEPGPERAAGMLETLQSPGTPSPLPRFTLSAFPEPGTETIEVFLQAPGRPAGGGVFVHAVGNGFYAGRVTLSALRRLIENGDIAAARLSRPVEPLLDRSGSYLGLAQARHLVPDPEGIEGITGRGVVIGIIDSGLDASHPDFRSADKRTRILRYWDHWYDNGPKPDGYFFGTEYRNTDIDFLPGLVEDLSGHGTHVAGIAAGNGFGSRDSETRYVGVAPEARLIGVRTMFTEVSVVLGARYVFERARAEGLPAVINLSLGNHFGPHVGTTFFEASLAELVGPGRLIVAAAGNEGAQDIHAEVTLLAGETASLPFSFPPYDKGGNTFAYLDIEGWFDRANRYRFTVTNPLGDTVGSLTFGDRNREFTDEKGIVRGWYTADLGMGTLLLEVEDNLRSGRLATGLWRVEVEALEVRGNPALDFWIVQGNGFRDGEIPRFEAHVDREETIISPATADRLLAVGAVSTRSCWTNAEGTESCYAEPPPFGAVAAFSSRGPTPDGRRKPEVVAPGFGVVSAMSGRIRSTVLSDADRAARSTPDGLYWINQGTSMSAPQAAGTVALLLQRYPEMTFEQMRHRLVVRGAPLADGRSGEALVALRTGEAVMPVVELALSEIEARREGVRIRWFSAKARDDARYRVYKGFAPEGPFFALSSRNIEGENPFTVLDRHPDPGRRILYRIAALDAAGLEDDLDTLAVETTGTARPVLRAPDPNPGRTHVALRYSLPASSRGGEFTVAVYDLRGRRVVRVEEGTFGPEGADGEAAWTLVDGNGIRVAGGVYFVSLRYGLTGGPGGSEVQRVVVLP
jgi:subtilisin family serine protease